jgi:hypothetical protein
VTARTVEGMAPYPGQARCLALGFWPECFRRLNVKGGQRSFPEETRSALDIEGKHVTIQGPSPDLTSSVSGLLRNSAHASSQIAMLAVLSTSGRDTSLATAPSGTRRAQASSSRTSGAAGRLAVVPAS